MEAQWPIGYGVRLRIKRSSVRIRPWPLRWVLGQGSLLPLSQGEAFTLASISYLAILVKYILAKKKKRKKKDQALKKQGLKCSLQVFLFCATYFVLTPRSAPNDTCARTARPAARKIHRKLCTGGTCTPHGAHGKTLVLSILVVLLCSWKVILEPEIPAWAVLTFGWFCSLNVFRRPILLYKFSCRTISKSRVFPCSWTLIFINQVVLLIHIQ